MNIALYALALLIIIAVCLTLSGALIMFLWNVIVPSMFGGSTMTLGIGIACAVALSIIGNAFRPS